MSTIKKKKQVKMIDPPRYPKVTVPIDNSFKKSYKDMTQSMISMLSVELIKK